MVTSSTTIESLIPDIYSYLSSGGWPDEDTIAKEVSLKTKGRNDAGPGRLRLSAMGPSCDRALWCSVHAQELAQPLPPEAIFKFQYGHIIEALVIALAKASGHEVTGEQDEVVVDGVVGHRDCVIDGVVVDVKSTATHMFDRFSKGQGLDEDPFVAGYLAQLDGYVVGSADDVLVRDKSRAYILAVDKQLGHMVCHEHKTRPEKIKARVAECKKIVSSDRMPECTCGTVADGESGNIRLDTKASYSPYKFVCFPELRTFLYSTGPRYLTRVVKRPYDVRKKQYVPEIDRHGKFVYN